MITIELNLPDDPEVLDLYLAEVNVCPSRLDDPRAIAKAWAQRQIDLALARLAERSEEDDGECAKALELWQETEAW